MSESSDVIQYFGVKKPDGRIWWITDSEQNSWHALFHGAPHRLPLDEAIRAYKAIGYRCVELEVKERW